MTIEREATCTCGQLKAMCRGEPAKVSLCHCIDCQRRTGSAFSIAAFYLKPDMTPSGESRVYSRDADSGYGIDFHFCPNCGGTLFWYPARMPELVAVAPGGFGDPDFPAPVQAVYQHRAMPWARDIVPGKQEAPT